MLQELSKDLFESYLHAELSCSFQNGRNVLFCPDDKSISIQTCYGRQWRMQSNNRVTSILGYNDDCRLSFASSVHHFPCRLKSLQQKSNFLWANINLFRLFCDTFYRFVCCLFCAQSQIVRASAVCDPTSL